MNRRWENARNWELKRFKVDCLLDTFFSFMNSYYQGSVFTSDYDDPIRIIVCYMKGEDGMFGNGFLLDGKQLGMADSNDF